MPICRRRLIKLLLAAGLGIPGTIIMVPLIAAAMLLGTTYLSDQFGLGLPSTALTGTNKSLLVLGQGISGLIGLGAFWLWVFTGQPTSPLRRVMITAGVVAGCLAIAPFLMTENAMRWFAAAGIVGGSIVVALTLSPNSLLQPNAKDVPAADQER